MLDNSPDLLWDDLLEHIEDRRVIPIIGQELLEVGPPGQTVPLYSRIAERLAERLKLPLADFAAPPMLNDVVCKYLENRGRREEIYPKIRAIMKEETFEIPEPLRKLAAIEHFNLFISVTFDSLLKQAIDAVRFHGESRTEVLSYAPNNVQDLPCEKADLKKPTVFHLLGKLSASPDYVITEEDTLEFLHSMQSDSRRAQLLFDELKSNHLLIIGCNFSDWLARFFIRIAKSRQLSLQRGEMEVFVDSRLRSDNNLVLFLQHFSYNTKVVEYSPIEFVDELSDRLSKRHTPTVAVQAPAAPSSQRSSRFDDDDDERPGGMVPGAVFISYASEDVEKAQALMAGLDEAGLDVWLDKQELEAGDEYSDKIRRNIRSCSYFLPLISQASTTRLEGFFIREWKWALERASSIADSVPFILPVVVDDTGAYNDAVPEGFQRVQWTRLPGGQSTAEFQMKLVRLVRDYRKRMRA